MPEPKECDRCGRFGAWAVDCKDGITRFLCELEEEFKKAA